MCHGFTLVELLVVIGIIAMLITLFLPVLAKARAASNATVCLSNLRQMASALTIYHVENRSHLVEYNFSATYPSDIAWNGYWLGVLSRAGVRGDALKCPSAYDPLTYNLNKGAGTSSNAWTGRFASNGTTMRFNAQNFREGSYGFNRYLTARGGFGPDGNATKLTAVRQLSNVPAFFDCILIDAKPANGSPEEPAEAPDNFNGHYSMLTPTQDQFKFLLNRHGKSINVSMADGSARTVRLEDTYTLNWSGDWKPYRLPLPRF